MSVRSGASSVPIVNAEAAARVGPFDVVELIADDPARAALDAALVRKRDPAILSGRVAGRRAAVDALLPLAEQADLMVDDADVRPPGIDVVGV